jgi:hypothetical protein
MSRCVLRFVFVTASVALLATADTRAAEPASKAITNKQPSPSAVELQRTARKALTDAAALRQLPDAAGVENLVSLYKRVSSDTELSASTRQSLRSALRTRLERWQAALARTRKVPNAIFAQQAPPVGIAQPQPTQGVDTLGPDLVKLIEETIHPTSWDTLGGPGVIRFWGPANVLVVRQTTDVHEDLEKLLGDLR